MSPIYLYGYGSRRHIADPGTPARVLGSITNRAYCGGQYRTDAEMARQLSYWASPKVAERRIERARQLPVCKLCAKAHQSSAPGETPPSLGADPNSVVVSPPVPLATTEPLSAAGGVTPAPPAAGSGLHPRADHRPSEGQDR